MRLTLENALYGVHQVCTSMLPHSRGWNDDRTEGPKSIFQKSKDQSKIEDLGWDLGSRVGGSQNPITTSRFHPHVVIKVTYRAQDLYQLLL